MKKKDILILVLIILNILLLLQNIGINVVEEVGAQISTKTIGTEKIYTNRIYVLGYDLLLMNQSLMNLLIKRGIITYQEAKKISENSKNENWLKEIGQEKESKKEEKK